MELENNVERASRLLDEYRDSLGRVTLFEAKLQDWKNQKYDSQNPHLWTGEAIILEHLFGDGAKIVRNTLVIDYFSKIHKCFVVKGLLARHPDPYRETEHFDAVSLDEILGVMFATVHLEGFEVRTSNIHDYLSYYGWFYYDKAPYMSPWTTFKNQPWKSIKEVFGLIKHVIKSKDISGNRETDKLIFKSEFLSLVTRFIQPKEAFIVKLTAEKDYNLLEYIHICLNIVNTGKKPNKLSGKCLNLFRILYIENKSGFEKVRNKMIYKWARNKYIKDMKKLFGENYIYEIFTRFYSKNHPFIHYSKDIQDYLETFLIKGDK